MERLLDARGLRPVIAWPRRGPRAQRATLGRLLRRRTVRRRALAVLILAAVAVVGWVALRGSPLVSVTHVKVTGVRGLYATQIDRALRTAAKDQSTMALDVPTLRAAVTRFGVVRDLHVSTGFPHTLRIVVVEQLPVATLVGADGHAAAAGDGTVLPARVAIADAPTIAVGMLPHGHVSNPRLLSELEALAPAPAMLLRRVTGVAFGPQGLTVTLRGGLQLYFGDSAMAHAKWIAAALVIGDPHAVGATYIDVRLPDRAAAGGLPGPAATGANGATSGATGATAGATTQASLAATLAAALAGSTPATPATAAGTAAGTAATPIGAGPTPSTPTSAGPRAASTGAAAGTSSSTGG